VDLIPPPTRQDLLSILVTEHFTLQVARSAAISDANGRASFFLGTLSGAVVALAFMAQLTGLAMQFTVFALVLLPTMLFIGLVTFERLVQLQLENLNCVRAINRIRHYYMEVAPEIAPHMTLSPFDDMRGMMTSLGSYRERLEWWQIFVTNAGMIAVVDAILAGVIAALVASAVGLGIAGSVVVALLVGALLLTGLMLYQGRARRLAAQLSPARFPGTEPIDALHSPREDAAQG
jgi:hypothetical protein